MLDCAENERRLSCLGVGTFKEVEFTRVELVEERRRGENFGRAVRLPEFPSCLSSSSPRWEAWKEGYVAVIGRDMINLCKKSRMRG